MNIPSCEELLGLSCCEIAECIYREPEGFIVSSRASNILSHRGIGGGTTSLILKHITECCGYEDFFEELARHLGKDKAELISYLGEKREIFTLCLGIVLKKDLRNSELYGRLWSCIPLIGNASSIDPNLQTFDRCSRIFGDVVDLEVLKDFSICTREIKCFSALLANVTCYKFFVSHPEGIVFEESPFTFCANVRDHLGLIRDVSLDVPDPEGSFYTISINTHCEVKMVSSLENDDSRYYIIRPYVYSIKHLEGLDYIPTADRVAMFSLKHHQVETVVELSTIYIPVDEIGGMFDLAYRQGCPVYINGNKVRLSSNSRAKSAKK